MIDPFMMMTRPVRLAAPGFDDPADVNELDEYNAPSVLASPQCLCYDATLDYIFTIDNDDDALVTFDVSDPSNMTNDDRVIDATNLPGPRNSMCTDGAGGYLYVGSGAIFSVWDISDPSNVSVVGTYDITTDTSSATFVVSNAFKVGDYVFMLISSGGLVSMDVSTPASPTYADHVTGYHNAGNYEIGMDDEGEYIYAMGSGSNAEIAIFDISTPTAISASTFTDATNINRRWGMTVKGDYLFVADASDDALLVFDISTRASPVYETEVSNEDLNNCRHPIILGDHLAIAGYNFAVKSNYVMNIIDISDPTSLSIVSNNNVGTGTENDHFIGCAGTTSVFFTGNLTDKMWSYG